mmetsp:Transcript_74614/g.198218  ORF Transcript_74614/g.198218 Transcript_74614/m.198218 type:complete len:201 (-) Transcript_74614:111-713(-)|eukprot:CAMPEP_0171186006 /NCGR_PEP_ID=MMETSP0790-20130122/16590_1 /TAXON_ID=2925 /ORGANISM="Alexandrium catenella, Strain OF101" /LENGTH=200 /DNA_ID=CAMNT_0011651037 /DNA_START=85 /DNA_END=687 /DNA_ORIENTATION=-
MAGPMAGPLRGVHFLASLAAVVAQEGGVASVAEQAAPRQLADGTSWVILNAQPASGTHGFFNHGTISAVPSSGAVPAQQWRLNEMIWTGSVNLLSGTTGMTGTCGASTCTARVVASPPVAGQWQLGDILMLPPATTPNGAAAQAEENSRNAMIMFILLLVFIALGLLGCAAAVHRSTRRAQKDAGGGLGSEAAEGGESRA